MNEPLSRGWVDRRTMGITTMDTATRTGGNKSLWEARSRDQEGGAETSNGDISTALSSKAMSGLSQVPHDK